MAQINLQTEISFDSESGIDWSKCVICQESTREQLQNPTNTKRKDVDPSASYEAFATNINRFHELGCLPARLKITDFKVQNLVETFKLRNACWHKKCRDKFNNTKLERAEKRHAEDNEVGETATKIIRRSEIASNSMEKNVCFFCGNSNGKMSLASTFSLDRRVRECAHILEDNLLLGKLSAGDMISQDALYHSKCLCSLYKRAAAKQDSYDDRKESERRLHGIVLAELFGYIQETANESETPTVFKLVDLANMYKSRLEELGVAVTSRIHTTELKSRLLSNFENLESHREGRDVLLAFDSDISKAIRNFGKDYDDEAVILSKAARIIRRDIFSSTETKFTGTFDRGIQKRNIPQSLETLVSMVLNGINIKHESLNNAAQQAVLSVSQLILFNSTVRRRKESSSIYHCKSREPALPIYLGLLLHAQTRKRNLVDKLYNLGLSVSYDRLLEISTDLGNGVIDRFEIEQVVCPPSLKKGLFTTSAVDNIDHNPSSNTAHGSLHGTGISLFQHGQDRAKGTSRSVPLIGKCDTKRRKISPLPEVFASVPATGNVRKELEVPLIKELALPAAPERLAYSETEYRWMDHVRSFNSDANLKSEITGKNISWAAFNASRCTDGSDTPPDIVGLLPLFQEEAHSVAMIRHSMSVVKQAVQFINQGQTPVIAFDQPLYALAKKVQWQWPQEYGEDHLVIMMGGLHIEMAALKAAGNWLEDSGWTNALAEAEIASSGKAESFISASHVSRTRHVHQVTACSLYILMNKAFDRMKEEADEKDSMQFSQWRKQREEESPQFKFWSLTMDLELAILILVRSFRERNFRLYIHAIKILLPWFFALDHVNYARWLSVHLRDMVELKNRNVLVELEFQQGNFTVRKSKNPFSSIAIDHAHEQNNKSVKGDGGIIGLTESPEKLRRWMIAGPEIARVIQEFEQDSQNIRCIEEDKAFTYRHHEQKKGEQKRFATEVEGLCNVFEEMGNPFEDTSGDLLVLDSRNVVDERVISTVNEIQNKGLQQFEEFFKECLVERTKSIFDPVKRNKFPLFRCPTQTKISKEKYQLNSLKKDCQLFSQLFIACQVRDGNLDEFFKHENHSCPPSLSKLGQISSGNKSDLTACLEQIASPQDVHPHVDAIIVDGAAIINMLKPRSQTTFAQYSDEIFTPYLKKQLQNALRLDIVWDRYTKFSLKAVTRSKRGIGIRRRVLPDSKIPGNWEAFLRVDENKSELFAYLAKEAAKVDIANKIIISTNDTAITTNSTRDHSKISPCSHEEADTRLLLHAADAVYHAYQRIMIRTVDTDVVVIAVSSFAELNASELWIAFGTGKNFRYIPVHNICTAMGPERARSLTAFHAFTGCDQTSFFAGRGKTTAWKTWKAFNEATTAFLSLTNMPTVETVDSCMQTLERFVVLMYDRTSTEISVDRARKELFSKKGRSVHAIPPTRASLYQHTKRVAYQAGHVWGQSMISNQQLPCPTSWGWQRGPKGDFEPFWTTLPEAWETCRELLKCGCNPEKGCQTRCKCVRAELLCTALCKCNGSCER